MEQSWEVYEGDCMKLLPHWELEADAFVTDPPYGINYASGWGPDDNAKRNRPKLPKEGVGAFVTDPPYGVSAQPWQRRKYDERKDIGILNDDQPFVWWLRDAYRLTREGGHLICFCRWDVAEAFRLAITWAGYNVKGQVIWDRDMHGVGDLNGQFAPQHDIIWHASKGKSQLYGTRPKSVIRIPRLHGEALSHPNEKPVALMRYLIRAVTKPGDLVVDPFAGSGSTGEAAIREGRRCIMVELAPQYIPVINNKMRSVQTDFLVEHERSLTEPGALEAQGSF